MPGIWCRSSTRWCAGCGWTGAGEPVGGRVRVLPAVVLSGGRRGGRAAGWRLWCRPGPGRGGRTSSPTRSSRSPAQAREAAIPALGSAELADAIAERFGVQVHPRSVERALARAENPKSGARNDIERRRPAAGRRRDGMSSCARRALAGDAGRVAAGTGGAAAPRGRGLAAGLAGGPPRPRRRPRPRGAAQPAAAWRPSWSRLLAVDGARLRWPRGVSAVSATRPRRR